MYGIGVRISTYLQTVMTIIAEFCTDPKFAAALTSVNLWFLWAYIFVVILAKETSIELQLQWIHLDIMKALGSTIGFTILGVVILPPTKQMEHVSAFTRFMQWATVISWLLIDQQFSLLRGIGARGDTGSENKDCNADYYWVFLVFRETSHRWYSGMFRLCFSVVSAGSLFFLSSGSLICYRLLYPGGIIRTTLKRSEDSLARAGKMPRHLFDLYFIYPAADIMVLMDAVSKFKWLRFPPPSRFMHRIAS